MFITFEGGEGSGKSTQAKLLVDRLSKAGHRAMLTREPGGTLLGEDIRGLILGERHAGMGMTTELLLFSAARAHLVETVIRPALRQGTMVVCDRFTDSTYAYQGFGHGCADSLVEMCDIADVTDIATGGIRPDLTVLMDIDVDAGMARKRGGAEWNRMDAKDQAFHERVRWGYHHMVMADPTRFMVVDGSQAVETVANQIWERVEAKIETHGDPRRALGR